MKNPVLNIEYDIIVVGGGASGLIAAGHAAHMGARVLLIEKMPKTGRKLMITGKGRCNVSNEAPMDEFFNHVHPGGKFLKHAFHSFFSKDIINLLESMGVKTASERGGRIFPLSNKASDIHSAFLGWCEKNKVIIRRKMKVTELIIENGKVKGLVVLDEKGASEVYGKQVILCTGGKSYPATGSEGDGYKMAGNIGHSIIPVRPALVPLIVANKKTDVLQGLSLKNVLAVLWVNGRKLNEAFGEMLFTHFGLSGPIILTLSRSVVDALIQNNKVEITIDLKPALDEQKLDKRLLRDIDEYGNKNLENVFKLWLPSKLIPYMIQEIGLNATKKGNQLSAKERKKIRIFMKNLRFKVTGYRPFKEAIITAGGIDTNEIYSKTMESKLVENLYFAGELINLDADTGGYNLQIAFSTGWLAAESAMKKIQ